MASIVFPKLNPLLLAIVALLTMLAACGAAETGGASSAPSAQVTIDRVATTEPTAALVATVAPTQASSGGGAEPTSVGTIVASQGSPVKDQVSLIDALRKAGATVTIGDPVEQPFLSVRGTQVTVNNADVQVFEYTDEVAAQADATKLADTLAGRRTVMISWVASPHAYRAGHVLALYIGDDAATLKLLRDVLGAPFAEQQLPAQPRPTAAPAATALTSHAGGQATDQVSLIEALRGNGLAVQPAGAVEQPFFEVTGTALKVNGADVQVFEFADTAAAKAAVAKIGPDGNLPTMIVEWLAPPHFYLSGHLVVLYVGQDKLILEALSKVLGSQVAGQ
jgi:hypothetical protein